MPAGNTANRVGHGQNRQTEGERDTQEANAEFRKSSSKTALPQPPKTSQKVPKNSERSLRLITFPHHVTTGSTITCNLIVVKQNHIVPLPPTWQQTGANILARDQGDWSG